MTTAPQPTPSPTTTRPFSISDIARAAARVLGDSWAAGKSNWETAGYLRGPFHTQFVLETDERQPDEGGDLRLTYTPHPADRFTTAPVLPDEVAEDEEGVHFEHASPVDGIDSLAELTAATIRAITTPALPEPYNPAPGSEYPFSVSDIARAAAHQLGDGWSAESGPWGVTGTVSGPYNAKFTMAVDYDNDLCISWDRFVGDGFPEHPELPESVCDYDDGVYLELAAACDGLEYLADRSAAAIRAVTGYNPDDYDFESSASRQHHADTGRYLRKGEAESA
ncbi:hypothetical protein [Streptomyces similanensis]|uniref:Uncharacterized protein n=1 Tax=Streptomyces similanensis TaxID=1274988 RepID=A0ABP9L3Y7_9ACTN